MHLATPEPHSLALACGLSSLFVGLVMASIRNPFVEARGANYFAASAAITSLSFFLVAFAPPMDFLVLTALRGANTVLLFGLLVAGIKRFVGQRVPWLALGLSMMLMAVLIQFYPDSLQDVAPRVVGFSALIMMWTLYGVWTLLRHRLPGLPLLGQVIAALGLICLALVAGLRAVLLLTHGTVSGAEALHSPLNSWLLLAGFAALLLTLTGLALLQNARMVMELARWSQRDPLTGINTRHGFNAQWPQWLKRHGPGHIVLMDLEMAERASPDDDGVLLLAQCLQSGLPPESLLSRQSGGGFLAALPQALDTAQVRKLCAALQMEVSHGLALQWAGRGVPPRLALGHAEMRQDLAEAARRANLAMQDGVPRRRTSTQ